MIAESRANALLGYEFGRNLLNVEEMHYLRFSFNAVTNETNYTEPDSSIGYNRIIIPNNTSTWGVPINYSVSNIIPLISNNFMATLPETQKLTHWFISCFENKLNPNDRAIYYGELLSPIQVIAGTYLWIDVGDIKIERLN